LRQEDRSSLMSEDLAGLFRGELRFDAVAKAAYASDGSLYEVTPLGVAAPLDRDDLAVLCRYASEHKIPLVPRGAGSGVAGEALGEGLIVDLSRHLTAVEAVGESSVRVQSGVVLADLNRAIRATGRYFPPDPSNILVTTIGGMLARDSAGSHSIEIGTTRDWVQSLEVVLASGASFEARSTPLTEINSAVPGRPGLSAPEAAILPQLAWLLRENADLIVKWQPATLKVNRCGYRLRDVLDRDVLNVPQVLVGSEGTLGFFSAATLRTRPIPLGRAVVLLEFKALEPATTAVTLCQKESLAACDLLDRRLLGLSREVDRYFETLISPDAEAVLILEWTTSSPQSALAAARNCLANLRDQAVNCRVLIETTDETDMARVWSLAQRVVPLLNQIKGNARPVPIVEDIAVPPAALHEFLLDAQRVLQEYEITASMYAHAAAGQIHLRPFLSLEVSQRGEFLAELSQRLYEATWKLGGTISGEHATGLSRSGFVEKQYGPLYEVFRQVKQLFDPQLLLNPQKVITHESDLSAQYLKKAALPGPELYELELRWSPAEFVSQASSCNGCGSCKTRDSSTRMCPFFRTAAAEERSPRAKAAAARQFGMGQLLEADLSQEGTNTLLESCFNCKQCQLDCPSSVNIPQLALELRAQVVAANGVSRSEWFLSRPDVWGPWGCYLAPLLNPLLNTSAFRWVMERIWGVARRRRLPGFARRPFFKRAPRHWLKRPEPNQRQNLVVYFVDHYASFHDPELAIACGKVLEHHGYRVYAPPELSVSGIALISSGQMEAARMVADQNLRILGEFARDRVPIVCTEPSTAVCLKTDYPGVVDHPDAETVADQVQEIGHFLLKLQEQGLLRTDFAAVPGKAVYHTPCHLRALSPLQPLLEICRQIPQLEIESMEKGCSGMAGTFGLKREHFAESLEIGQELIKELRRPVWTLGMTECSSCKLQMEQKATIPTIHPLKLLALSYGLMPEIRSRLRAVPGRLVTT
jgi:FAD/FMN-containing dehydrogenase/Fe-S oxidoreductase